MSSGWRSAGLFFLVFALVTCNLFMCVPSYGQVSGATVNGTVTDATGAAVPDVKISANNVATGVVRETSSSAAGFYQVPNLVPGNYTITASATGFATLQTQAQLTVGAEQVLNFTMQVGAVSQNIEVTATASTVQLESSSIGNVVDSNTVRELPLNARDWTSLATLQPAVIVVQTQVAITGTRANRGYGSQLSIAGTRPQSNNYRLNGLSISDYSGGGPGNVMGVTLGVDSVAEFSVLTSNYSAEYGRTSGGVINAIMRSGTNQFHGTAFWFLRDEGLDARSFFDTKRLPFHRNQFGGSGGGPIKKDKAFFFANYEGVRQTQSTTAVDVVPSLDAHNGISHPTTSTSGVVDSRILPYLALYPLPTSPVVAGSNIGTVSVGLKTTGSADFVTSRIDWKISERNSFSGAFYYDRGSTSVPDVLNNTVHGNQSLRDGFSLEQTHVFSPTLVNTLRGGYSRIHVTQNVPILAINPLAAMSGSPLAILPGTPAPTITVSSMAAMAGGLSNPSRNEEIWNSIQIYDDAFLSRGAHSFKFGFAAEIMKHSPTNRFGPGGSWNFSSVQDFYNNVPQRMRAASPLFRPTLHQNLFGGYFQDDWKIRPNLTLNLGLRYEMVTMPTEDNNKLANLRNYTDNVPTLGAPYVMNPTKLNFEPRVGFAYDPFRDGKTSIRGAFGIFDALPLMYEFYTGVADGAPYNQNISLTNSTNTVNPSQQLQPGDFPSKLSATVAARATGTQFPYTYVSLEFNPHRNYVMIWNMNIQRQLTPNLSLMVGYVGNRGIHMFARNDDTNIVLPTAVTSAGLLWPVTGGVQINPGINSNAGGLIENAWWGGQAYYNALEVTVIKKFSHNFQVQGSYTWGKNIDTSSASTNADAYTNFVEPLWFCSACSRGLSDFDIRHNVSINAIWQLPSPKSWGSIASYTLGGWQLGGIFSGHTGSPFTPGINGDPLGTKGNVPFAFPDRSTGSGCETATNPGNVLQYINVSCFSLPLQGSLTSAQCAPFLGTGTAANPQFPGTCRNLLGTTSRGSLIGPGLVNVDFSVFKNNYIKKISETFNAQFRAEFFNVFNRPNFGPPVNNKNVFNANGTSVASAGKIDTVVVPGRQIQLALKLVW